MRGISYFFLFVFMAVTAGVLAFVPQLAAAGRWDLIAFFASLLLFIAWRIWVSRSP
jgi:hypothetical protein